MTATDRLRAMLDERGVDWGTTKGCDSDSITPVHVDGRFGGTEWEAFELADGTFQVTAGIYDELTPEQFLAATLGAGTCEMHRDKYGVWHCSSCEKGADKITGSDGALESWNDSWPPNFCPNCGRKVEG